MTWPVPLHVVHVTTGPPVSPAPWHREHWWLRFTVMLVVRPVKASSKLSARGISMSRPFFERGRGGSGSRRVPVPAPPKRSEKMSRKLELPPEVVPLEKSKPEKSKPAVPPPLPAAAPAPNGESGSRLSL